MLRIGDDRATTGVIDQSRQHAGPLLHVQRYGNAASGDENTSSSRHTAASAVLAKPLVRLARGRSARACMQPNRTTQLRISPHAASHDKAGASGTCRAIQSKSCTREALMRRSRVDRQAAWRLATKAAILFTPSRLSGTISSSFTFHAQLLFDEENDLQHAGGIDDIALEQRVIEAEGRRCRR